MWRKGLFVHTIPPLNPSRSLSSWLTIGVPRAHPCPPSFPPPPPTLFFFFSFPSGSFHSLAAGLCAALELSSSRIGWMHACRAWSRGATFGVSVSDEWLWQLVVCRSFAGLAGEWASGRWEAGNAWLMHFPLHCAQVFLCLLIRLFVLFGSEFLLFVLFLYSFFFFRCFLQFFVFVWPMQDVKIQKRHSLFFSFPPLQDNFVAIVVLFCCYYASLRRF